MAGKTVMKAERARILDQKGEESEAGMRNRFPRWGNLLCFQDTYLFLICTEIYVDGINPMRGPSLLPGLLIEIVEKKGQEKRQGDDQGVEGKGRIFKQPLGLFHDLPFAQRFAEEYKKIDKDQRREKKKGLQTEGERKMEIGHEEYQGTQGHADEQRIS